METIFLVDEKDRKFGAQLFLYDISGVTSGSILSKIVFLEIRNLEVHFPKKIFEHFQIFVLIYRQIEKYGLYRGSHEIPHQANNCLSCSGLSIYDPV